MYWLRKVAWAVRFYLWFAVTDQDHDPDWQGCLHHYDYRQQWRQWLEEE